MKRKILILLSIAAVLLFLFPTGVQAQVFKNKTKKENDSLRVQLDSLKRVIEELRQDILLKDSVANEMLGIYEENEDKGAAGQRTTVLKSLTAFSTYGISTGRSTRIPAMRCTTWIQFISPPTFRMRL